MPTPDNIFKGIDSIGQRDATSYILGYNDTVFLDASAADASFPAGFDNCRAISIDDDGIVKIDYSNNGGNTVTEVKNIKGGVIYPIRNVTKLYRYYTGTTAGTAKSYNSSGIQITNAIKLHR